MDKKKRDKRDRLRSQKIMDTNPQTYYTTDEVADLLKVNTESVRRWVRDNKLKAVKLSHKFIRISQDDLDQFIKTMRGGNNGNAVKKRR